MVPRLVANAEQNERFNAQFRYVTRSISSPAAQAAVQISQTGPWPPVLREDVLPPPAPDKSVVRVQQSALAALNVGPNMFLYPIVGVQEATGKTVLALSTDLASRTKPIVAVPLGESGTIAAALHMSLALGQILAVSVLSVLPEGSQLLVHEVGAVPGFAAALGQIATARGVGVSFTTATTFSVTDDDAGDWIRFDAWTPKHVLRRRLPADLTHLLDLSTDPKASPVSATLEATLSSACRHVDTSDLFRHHSRIPAAPLDPDQAAGLVRRLEDIFSRASAHPLAAKTSTIPLSHVQHANGPLTIVDWNSNEEALKLQLSPIDGRRLFSKEASYLLVGLTGQIGQSLTEWTVRNGAGCICLTSCHPNVSERWLCSFEGTGSVVKVFAMDVTSKQAVKETVNKIKATCPPVQGVANGAMVLRDMLAADMSFDNMADCLRPKVDGSNHLAEAFANDALDFFVMFSSLSAVIGNPGQANYAAANAYMQSFAKLRRKRGIAASTFDIGRVVGIGYVERADPAVKEQLMRQNSSPRPSLPAGHVETPSPVLTTAIFASIDKIDKKYRPRWADDVRFLHCIPSDSQEAAEMQVGDGRSGSGAVPVMEQVAAAKSNAEALAAVAAAFVSQLRIILQMGDREVDQHSPLVDIGIDSLVAVEVRSWFVKELKVDLPVLKILGGATIAELAKYALSNLPEKIRASMGHGQEQSAKKNSIPASTTTQPSPVQGLSPPTATSVQLKSDDTTSASSDKSDGIASPPPESTPISSAASETGSMKADGKKMDLVDLAAPPPPPLRFVNSAPVSFAQSRFWFLRMLLQDQATFTVSCCYKVTQGALRVPTLERAVTAVAARHESLRTAFVGDDIEADKAYQKTMETSRLRLEQKLLVGNAEQVTKEFDQIKNYQFDIERGEAVRIVLLSLRPPAGPSEHYLVFAFHHIFLDGFSFDIILQELEKAYKGQSLGPPPRPMSFFAKQLEAYGSGKLEEALTYWRRVFSEELPVLPLLPMVHVASRVAMNKFDHHQAPTWLEPDLAARVKKAAKAARSTPSHVYLAAFKSMLFRLIEAQDLTIGMADTGRDTDAMASVGLFLNLVTLRFRRPATAAGKAGGQPFADAVTETRNTAYAALAASVPIDVLLKDLNMEMWDACPGRTAYDLTLDVNDSPQGTIVAFRAQASLYDAGATDLLLQTYVGLLQVLTADVAQLWETVPLFGAKLLTRALDVGRRPACPPTDWPETLPHRIDQVVQNPDNRNKVALMDGLNNSVTYVAMGKRIEALAGALLRAGLGSGSRVLVFEQAASDWVCSMLAIMRIGGFYVPLDLRNPLPRLAGIAQDCQPGGIMVDATTAEKAAHLKAKAAGDQIIDISQVASEPSAPVPNCARADSTAAVLYTSGSTGTPKGILVKHSGLRNEIEGYTKTWGLGAERALQQSAFTFNHSSDQIYTGLVNGGMVYIVPWSQRGDALEITDLIQKQGITYTKATPSEYSLWLQYGAENLRRASAWRFAFGGGETLTSPVLRELQALHRHLPKLRFFNSYGPTEISISSQKMEVLLEQLPSYPEGRVPCGYSLPNYVTYILDEKLQPVPCGMPGEVFLGGAGIAEGYLNDPELSATAFLSDPHAARHPDYVANGWTRMYRTGDIGHLTPDGALVFHHHIAGDSQVKIRGLRIELSDTESNLITESNGVVREAVITLREGNTLVAHVVFAGASDERSDRDRDEYLRNLLARLPIPQYIIPVLAVPIDKLPLSNHAKVDRAAVRALPLPEGGPQQQNVNGNGSQNAHLLPTDTMVLLKRVWEDVLGGHNKSAITPSTSFFAVGGNSHLIVRLQARLRAEFYVAIRLVDLLGANTLGEMAHRIDEKGVAAARQIDWDQETRVPDALFQPSSRPAGAEKIKMSGVVLLTGATGARGSHVLPRLAADQGVAKIYCLVRKPAKLPGPVPGAATAVVPLAGDLALPRLGLDTDTFAALAAEVDAVLHLGAARSFCDGYHSLRATNVGATSELVRMAAARRILIHFVSSAAVVGVGAGEGLGSANARVPPADGANGNVATKWASERILARLAEAVGLPVRIHRFVRSPAVADATSDEARAADLARLLPDPSG